MSTQRQQLFIAHSSKARSLASRFYAELLPSVEPVLWSQAGVFGASQYTLEALEAALDAYDYALIVLSADDVLVMDDAEQNAPRDNVIFEAGLFVGRHGRESVFLAVPHTDDNLTLSPEVVR